MKANHVIALLAGMVVSSVICLCSLARQYSKAIDKCNKADAYIERLEQDFPDYLDVSAESDEYSEYYNVY